MTPIKTKSASGAVKNMKLKAIIKTLIPYIVGVILIIAVVIFVLLQLSAASYLVLLVSINVIVLWIWIKSNNDLSRVNKLWSNNTNEFFDRILDAESEIRDIKKHLNMNDDENN